MSEDREQGGTGEREDASRPSTAAARRERRASARPAARKARAGRAETAASTGTTEAKGRPTPARDDRQRRVSPIKKVGRFLREVVAELRKVIWPSRKQLGVYTLVVLVFVSVMVAFVAGLDLLFAKGVLWLFG